MTQCGASQGSVAPEADLVDAVARGRVCVAELLHLGSKDLDALFMVAIARLETQRASEASDILGGLVALYPYDARFWRALGVARQNSGHMHAAAAAYRTSLVLEPEHALTQCYLGEVLLEEDYVEAVQCLMAAAASAHTPAAGRASRTLELLRGADEERDGPVATDDTRKALGVAPSPAPHQPPSDFVRLTTRDGRPLPLTDGLFAQPEAPTDPSIGAGRERLRSDEEVTNTGIIGREPASGSRRRRSSDDATATGRIARPKSFPSAMERRRHGPPLTEDITQTDIKARP